MNEPQHFLCSICGEAADDICVYCTKDICGNHLCLKCRRCSDCCECEAHTGERQQASPTSLTA